MSATVPASAQASLFETLGGFEGMERVAERVLTALASDATLSSLVPPQLQSEARWQLQLLLTDRMGGPAAYDGPEPTAVAARLALDSSRWQAIGRALIAGLAAENPPAASLQECERILIQFGASLGLSGTPVSPEAPRQTLEEKAAQVIAQAGLGSKNLFVLDPAFTVVALNDQARTAARSVDGELRRAFGVGADELQGQPILRFHPAPTQLHALLDDTDRLPRELLWSFGRVVWKAIVHPVKDAQGGLAGYAIAWTDESHIYRDRAVIERLRGEAEDLPVPVMFPDATLERWYGNPACEHALARLAPYLPAPVSTVAGIPIGIFLPDRAEREQLFGNPASLPFKRQIRFGPETVSLLVAPILDETQRYIGPQITWEIVHFSQPRPEPAEPAPPAGVPAQSVNPVSSTPASAPAVLASGATASAQLRTEARSLEAAAQELVLLTRLLLSVADHADHSAPAAVQPDQVAAAALRGGEETAQMAQAALEILAAARDAAPSGTRRPDTDRALATLNGIARRANRLAVEGAMLAVEDDSNQVAERLVEETRAFSRGLSERLRALRARAQDSSSALDQSAAAAARLGALREQLGPDHEDGGV